MSFVIMLWMPSLCNLNQTRGGKCAFRIEPYRTTSEAAFGDREKGVTTRSQTPLGLTNTLSQTKKQTREG